jgi:tRNA (guanine-N7-)-methyltransferase
MGAPGRPTPQPLKADGERPRFLDRAPAEARVCEVNPFVASHRDFGGELLTADEAWRWKGRWAERFGRPGPLHVEIGSGNGFFLTGLAQRNPDWNLLGVEIRYKRVVICATKLRTAGVTNAVISRYHAAYLDDLLEPRSVDGMYVNHPDPWPKGRHEKNRVISRWFLEDVARFVKPGGWLRVKSDFQDNVDRIEGLLDHGPDGEPLPSLPLKITGIAYDIANHPAPWPDDILTNYQRKMRERGVPVHAIEVVRTEDRPVTAGA